MSTIAARVARGAALLDETQPGWAAKINTKALDIESAKRCILGQLFGSYGTSPIAENREKAASCGFISNEKPHWFFGSLWEYRKLRKEWLREIDDRLWDMRLNEADVEIPSAA